MSPNRFKVLWLFAALSFIQAVLAYGQGGRYPITAFGAVGDGTTLCTSAIQAAIDSCHRHGGGSVVIPSGRFLTGTVELRDNVFLELAPGAVMLGSTDLADYRNGSLIYAEKAHHVGLIGRGTIDGQGDFFWRGKQRPYHRPERTVKFYECRDVLIRDVEIRNSAMFNVALEHCDRVNISGVSIINDLAAPNTDGIDPISSSNVFISDCYIETGDDAICPKSNSVERPCENIVVTNCVLISDDSAIKFGTASRGAIRNCRFSNIVIRNTRYGITFFMKDGGVFEDIHFSAISIETTMPEGESSRPAKTFPIFLDIERRRPESPLGIIRNIGFRDIDISTLDGNCLIAGMPEQKIEGLGFDGVRMRVRRHTSFEGRRKPRGTRSLKNLAPNDYAAVPAHFTLAHVKGLDFRNVTICDEAPDSLYERCAIWALDVERVRIEGLRLRQAVPNQKEPILKFTDAKGLDVRACRIRVPEVDFLQLAGPLTRDVSIRDNDLDVRDVVSASDGVKQDELFLHGNRSE